MPIKGLTYDGTANGMQVQLYDSYKTVVVTWAKPYKFVSPDDVSDDAKKYYLKNYAPHGVKIIEESEQDAEPDKVPDSVGIGSSDGEKVDEKVDGEPEDGENSGDGKPCTEVAKDIVAEYGSEVVKVMSDSDLCELLDTKFDTAQVHDICSAVSYDRGRRSKKSSILSELVVEKKAEILEYLLNA